MATIAARLEAVRERVRTAAAASGRAPDSVTLVAVGKTFPAATLLDARAAGQRDFGESYVQEALPKIQAFAGAGATATWHFIGPVQGNKTGDLARHFDWVHGIDREKIAQRLSAQRPVERGALQVCVQVNISGEATKSGVPPARVVALCRHVASLPNLRLRGLMAIPAPDGPAARRAYRDLRELFEAVRRGGLDVDTLSAGMSDDFESAIAEGSTMVRIGAAIFGPRQ